MSFIVNDRFHPQFWGGVVYHPKVLDTLYPTDVEQTLLEQEEGETPVKAVLRSLGADGVVRRAKKEAPGSFYRCLLAVARCTLFIFAGLVVAPIGFLSNGTRVIASLLSSRFHEGTGYEVSIYARAAFSDLSIALLTSILCFASISVFRSADRGLMGVVCRILALLPLMVIAGTDALWRFRLSNCEEPSLILRREFGYLSADGGMLRPYRTEIGLFRWRGETTIVEGPYDSLIVHHERIFRSIDDKSRFHAMAISEIIGILKEANQRILSEMQKKSYRIAVSNL